MPHIEHQPRDSEPAQPALETFGGYIKRLRETHNARAGRPEQGKMSQQLLASEVGVSKGYISQIESDRMPPRNTPPRVSNEVLRQLAHALQVSEEEMFNHSWLTPSGFTLNRTHEKSEDLSAASPHLIEANFRVSLADFLRNKRVDASMSRSELAERGEIREYDLHQIEDNRYDDLDPRIDSPDAPLIELVKKIQKVLRFSLAEIGRSCAPCPVLFLRSLRWDERIDRLIEAYQGASEELRQVFDNTADLVLKDR